jgi:maltose/maltodextrin transport system permease protein
LSTTQPALVTLAPRILVIGAAVAASLYAVMLVHASGQSALALALLMVSSLAIWTYTSKRTHALPYLFPGIAAALVFVVFPMLYTMGIGFTNRSSTNLLDYERARTNLSAESTLAPGSRRAFALHAEGDKYRVSLLTAEVQTWLSAPINLSADKAEQQTIDLQSGAAPAASLPMRDKVRLLAAVRGLSLKAPDGAVYSLLSLREFAQKLPLYESRADGSLKDRVTGKQYKPDMRQGFFASDDGDLLQPGFQVSVGWQHYAKLFTDNKFREPFVSVFIWTVVFAALSVIGAAALGLLLASLMSWDRLRFRGLYRVVLFLPYAVPGFLSILIFKGLFNQNLGEVNLILNALLGFKPAWFSDPLLAKIMLLIVNIWLGFPYMMVLCSGLLQSIPTDLREASAEAGAGPFTHFWRITLPLIIRPLLPLLIAAFAFNFNNFVLVSLLTGGRPDLADATLPAGTTDILVSYTWRIAFNDSGQQYGLAAAISTMIFLLVAIITLVQLRYTRAANMGERK